MSSETGKTGDAWVDPDDAPELTREWFERAEFWEGNRLIRPARPAGSNSLDLRPLAGAIGAEIFNVDLADLDDATAAAIRQVWLDHLVIFFRDQNLTPAQLLAFARRIGQPIEYPFLKGLDGFPEITPVVKLEHERVNFGGIWHSDTAYLERPPMGSMLLARARSARSASCESSSARCCKSC